MAAKCLCIILAAGEGTRMRSSLPKVLHKIANLPMVCHVIETLAQIAVEKILVVLGNKAELVKEAIASFVAERHDDLAIDYVVQKERLGTAHAVLVCSEELAKQYEHVLIVFGDTPLIEAEYLERANAMLDQGIDIAVFGFRTGKPEGYGRLIEIEGKLTEIIEEKDASVEQKQINFCNGGLMALSGRQALALLEEVNNNNNNREFYLTDIIKIAKSKNLTVTSIEVPLDNVMGVNNAEQLAAADAVWQQRKRAAFLAKGVSLQMPETIYFSYNTQIEPGACVEPYVYFGPDVYVAANASIHAFSYLEGAQISNGAKIGPFARLRSGSNIGEDVKIGNFCEVKNSHIDAGAKLNHLSYIGDAIIGAKTNIGAGVITCNYDGQNKWQTIIEPGVFVGSNSSLVAPIIIKNGAYIGSGSVITEDVAPNALAIARARQVNKDNYAITLRQRSEKIIKQGV